ncbi:ABC transporter ATP-binding protein [Leptolyngbya sp. FACHB-261]|uniref:ABC transporter ATP-binding protein n=1 Tax=Leptolyngbya sp. FACHB-261 TaxID=2692806 RepID=UPI001685D006|nr:ABC transporter ATP-binding protein [Leptolyngbya sp. FACHB-261]MBD2102996.1 ABC transporter ATP-binding protein [Leptolyngbya sp. FACHB-261]
MTLASNDSPLVQLRGICKHFGNFWANRNVDLDLYAGEIHALVGENGAGKSTLMKILYGFYRADGGETRLAGKPVHFHSPRDAQAAGVGMVFQHFSLCPSLTVAENTIVGQGSWLDQLNLKRVEAQLRTLIERYHLQLDPKARIKDLSMGERQRVEILKLLYRGAEVLILDEPTSVLSPPEVDVLLQTLRQLAEQGKALLFVSHKLNEVLRCSDRVSVLRRGEIVAHCNTSEIKQTELSRLMVGSEVADQLATNTVAPAPQRSAQPILRVQNLYVKGTLAHGTQMAVRDVSFELHGGEVLGIAGVAGNGQRELAEALAGIIAPAAGQVWLRDANLTHATPNRRVRLGMAYVPEDPLHNGMAPNQGIAANLILRRHQRKPYAMAGCLNWRAIRRSTREPVSLFDVRSPSPDSLARHLSGGNLQKLVMARELWQEPDLLIAAHPTVGLDIAATAAIHTELLAQRDRGGAVLLVSEDLDELLKLCDWIAVLYDGKLMGIVPPRAGKSVIGPLMAGQATAEVQPKIESAVP